MKNLQITGLAQETDFSDPEKTRSVVIIDDGKLRLEISDASVESLLKYAVSEDDEVQGDVQPSPVELSSEADQEEPAQQEDEEEEESEDRVHDEAGIAQI